MQTQDWDSTQNDQSVTLNETNFDSTAENSETSNSSTATGGTSSPIADNSYFQTLKTELEDAKNKLNELTIISQHALADLQNFKKRTEEEKNRFVSFANSNLITDLLPVLDNLSRSIAHIPENSASKEWAQGIVAIIKQMEQILSEKGLTPIETLNQSFNPNFHEALATQSGPADQIIKELEKGYYIGERVLRRAKVIVGNGEENPEDNEQKEALEKSSS